MQRKSKCMPLEDHLKTAEDLAIAQKHLSAAFFRVQEYYPISGKLMKQFYRLLPGTLTGAWPQLKSLLDSEYHRIISDKQFLEMGHIYYKDYSKMKSAIYESEISPILGD